MKKLQITNYKSQNKGIALILTLLILAGLLGLALGISTLLVREIKLSQEIANSVVAYSAADTGIERFMYAANKKSPPFDPTTVNCLCSNDKKYCFCDDGTIECVADSCSGGCSSTITLSSSATYEACTKKDTSPIEIKSTGTFRSTNRTIQISY